MKKYFLTTVFVMGLMAPAFGAITGGPNTCTVEVLGVHENDATANTIATWALNNYECGAGQYLVVDGENIACEPCPTGSYCPGGTYTIENASDGENSCPTGYTQSNAGASANTECYTNCTVANANIAHATAVTGNDYYGTGTDTCAPTDCDFGYGVEISIIYKQLFPWTWAQYSLAKNAYGSEGVYTGGIPWENVTYETEEKKAEIIALAGLTEKNTWAALYQEGSTGDVEAVVYGRASCQPNGDKAFEYMQDNIQKVWDFDMTISDFRAGLEPLAGTSKTDYIIDGIIGDFNWFGTPEPEHSYYQSLWGFFGKEPNANYSTDSKGRYCYCQMDGFMPTGGTKEIVTSAPWVIAYVDDSADSCADNCAFECARNMGYVDPTTIYFIRALRGELDYEVRGGMCSLVENNCPSGTYFSKTSNTMECLPCPSGVFCPGGVFTIESTENGTNACPSGYPNSMSGAGSDAQCYKACTVDAVNIPHAAAVGGKDYYGAGTDTCYITECDTGYHIEGNIELVERNPLVNMEDFAEVKDFGVVNGYGIHTFEVTGDLVLENNTAAIQFDNGMLYMRASCQPAENSMLGYINENMPAVESGAMSMEEFYVGLAAINPIKADYLMKMYTSGETLEDLMMYVMIEKNVNYSTNSSGKYCYFQVNAFQLNDGVKTELDTLWFSGSVIEPDYTFKNADDCAANCIEMGFGSLLFGDSINYLAFLGALDYVETGTCSANTINIDWNPDNGGAHTQNMCLYDGAITLPTPDPVKPGYVFSGWKLMD